MISIPTKGLVEKLEDIAKHDWRISFLSHVSDTAAEAATAIRKQNEGLIRSRVAISKLMRFIISNSQDLPYAIQHEGDQVKMIDSLLYKYQPEDK